MNEVSVAEPRTAPAVATHDPGSREGDYELSLAAESALGHSDFVKVLQLSRRGGLALFQRDGGLRVFKYISCQADWKKRWARRVGWNPARRAHNMSNALSDAGIQVCQVEDHGGISLEAAPRAVWTVSRYIENGRTLRQLKEQLQPGSIPPTHPLLWELFDDAMRLLRTIHDAGFEHRDYHAGNLLVTPLEGDAVSAGNARLHLVDLDTVMQRRAGIRRRARDISRFLENFITPGHADEIIERAMNRYAPDDPAMVRGITRTRRMNATLQKKARQKQARRQRKKR